MYQEFMLPMQASLSNLSSDELKDLLNDDEKLENRVTEAIVRLQAEKEGVLIDNQTLAETNLALEPKLLELKAKVGELTEEGKALCSSVQEKLDAVKSRSGSMNQDAALAKLQVAALESEEESEKIVKSFLDNEQPLESFLEQFMQPRITMHLRKIKAEKMKEVIKNPRKSFEGFFPTTFGVPYSTPGAVPYPLGPMHMPMPGMPRQF